MYGLLQVRTLHQLLVLLTERQAEDSMPRILCGGIFMSKGATRQLIILNVIVSETTLVFNS